ncbi:unnamed protein product [Peronospora farinosa]|uniref:Uncharacterized protein n=1 Tax=Peronospora farinosa TaxID=134698 RepID=A0AAV0T6Z7_9STRA|nr:unnamed protein product [Peronospora farinosa]
MARHKKRRVAALDEEAAHRTFLQALEAQRANANRQKVEIRSENEEAAPSPVVPIPGFYYDEAKRRYFRSCPVFEQRRRKHLEMQERKITVEKAESKGKTCHLEYGKKTHNWVNYLSQRQSHYTWSARNRDSRELIPQYLSNFLSVQVLTAQALVSNDRYTALALHPKRNNVGAIGDGSGKLNILKLERRPLDVESTTSSPFARPVCNLYVSGLITSLQWRPVEARDLLMCHFGSDSIGGSQTGNVCFFRVSDLSMTGAALMATAHVARLKFVDPWTARWNPIDTNKFSVGCGGSSSAAYVDAIGNTSNFQHAPPGAITSDVHAQSFFGTGHVVLNGTTSGGLWGWDIRAPRRIFEWEVNGTANQPTGSVLDIHMLNDGRRAVVQRSNGELRIVDLRTFRPVVELIQGATKQYLPSLRCAIDSYESVVVSGGDAKYPLAINSYDLQSGRRVASIEMQNAQTSEKRPTSVQQVQLTSGHHGSRFEDIPEIWAISRDELYVCSGRADNPAN